MADNRKIVRGIRIGTETVTDADRLESLLTAGQIASLAARGHVTGNFKGKGAGREEGKGSPSPDAKTKAELREEAEGRGLEVPANATKAEIVALLEGK
jgi:hypothetical protein